MPDGRMKALHRDNDRVPNLATEPLDLVSVNVGGGHFNGSEETLKLKEINNAKT